MRKVLISGLAAALSFLAIGMGLIGLLPSHGGVSDYQLKVLMVIGTRFYIFMAGLIGFMLAWSFIYFLIQRSLSGQAWKKGLLFGGLLIFVGFWLQHRFYLSLLYMNWSLTLFGPDLLILLIASLGAGFTLAVIQEKG